MIVYLNDKFVPEAKAVLSVFDRGFLYGDGLFEGMVVSGGRPFRWGQHVARLQQGLKFLRMPLPVAVEVLGEAAQRLIRVNKMPEAMLRLSVSRGRAARGYSPRNATDPAVVMTLHPLPDLDWSRLTRWRAVISSFRLPANDPLTAFKTANKLTQVLARGEADEAGAQEALLLNTRGYLAEGTTSNIFWIRKGMVFTPPVAAGALPGVTRGAVWDVCRARGLAVKESNARPAILARADGVFLTMSSAGVVEVESLNGKRLRKSLWTQDIWRDYRALLRAETAVGV